MSERTIQIAIRPDPDLTVEIESRIQPGTEDARGPGRGSVVRESLERYFALLEAERRELRKLFTGSECAVMLAILNGTIMSASSMQAIEHEFEDGIYVDADGNFTGAEGLDGDTTIDVEAFMAKVKRLRLAQRFAVADAAERWWNRVGRGENPGFEEMFR